MIDVGYFDFKILVTIDKKIITDIKWISDTNGCIKIFKKPEKNKPYVLGGDTAGEGSDNFTGVAIDNVNDNIVAVLKHEKDETYYTRQIYCLGIYYNTALVGLETNYSTYPTKMLAEEYEYPNLYVREKVDDYTNKLEKSFGFETNKKTRPLILAELQRIFSENIEQISDVEILKEGVTFVKNEKGRPEAQEGSHDDLIMGTAIAYHIKSQQSNVVQIEEDQFEKSITKDFGFEEDIQGDFGSDIEVF